MSKVIVLTEISAYKDGGSTTYIGTDNKHYWLDNQIGTSTKGILFLGNYKDRSTKASGSFEVAQVRRAKIFIQ